MHCYLSDFLHTNNNLSCIYVISLQENLNINGQLLDKNSGIKFLEDKLQESFDRISSNFKQIQKGDKLLVYSMDIDISKLPTKYPDKPQWEEIIEVTEEDIALLPFWAFNPALVP